MGSCGFFILRKDGQNWSFVHKKKPQVPSSGGKTRFRVQYDKNVTMLYTIIYIYIYINVLIKVLQHCFLWGITVSDDFFYRVLTKIFYTATWLRSLFYFFFYLITITTTRGEMSFVKRS